VLNTKRAGFPDDEVARHGVTVCGTVHPDLNTLKALLHEHFACAIIIEVQSGGKHEVLTGPFYLPPLSAPPLYELGLFDDLQLEKWPLGIYDITILSFPDPRRDRFILVDQFVNGAVYTEEGDILAVQLDHVALTSGKVKDLTGKQLQMADPIEVKGLQDVEAVVEEVPEDVAPLRMRSTFEQRVEEELDTLLDEVHDDEDDEEEGGPYAD
jgi:hypothetical protein